MINKEAKQICLFDDKNIIFLYNARIKIFMHIEKVYEKLIELKG